jgi:hypothetical protein
MTQSAYVEHVRKAHKVVHTKVRNRLKIYILELLSEKLLYYYVNLRLLKRMIGQEDFSNKLSWTKQSLPWRLTTECEY